MSADRKHLHRIIPPADVSKTGEDVIVYFDLPGVEKEQIKLQVEGDRLQLICQKPDLRPSLIRGVFQLMEREFGFFRRDLLLPSGLQPEKAEATMDNGVLMIRIPLDRSPVNT